METASSSQKRKQNKTGNRPNSPKPEANHQNPKAKKKPGTRSARAGSSAQPNRRHDQTPGKHQARPAPPRSARPRQSPAPLIFPLLFIYRMSPSRSDRRARSAARSVGELSPGTRNQTKKGRPDPGEIPENLSGEKNFEKPLDTFRNVRYIDNATRRKARS